MNEVSRFECGECKHRGGNCKCIDHKKVHFGRSCFSCDEYTMHHMICRAFEPIETFPAIVEEWKEIGGFDNYHKLYVDQWLNGKEPKFISIIRPKATKEGREAVDDIWYVPYADFINCEIMKPDGIHYVEYKHIEKSRQTVTGYKWVTEGGGILD